MLCPCSTMPYNSLLPSGRAKAKWCIRLLLIFLKPAPDLILVQYSVTVIRDLQAVNFTCYDIFKRKLSEYTGRETLAPWQHMILGGVSGGIGPCVNNPLDVVKTRLQKQVNDDVCVCQPAQNHSTVNTKPSSASVFEKSSQSIALRPFAFFLIRLDLA